MGTDVVGSSGHGTQVEDVDGDEVDEDDEGGFDLIMCEANVGTDCF